MVHISGIISGMNLKQTEQKQPLQEASKPLEKVQSETGKQMLASLIYQCFNGLKTYGKEPEQLEGLNGMFMLALADFPISQVEMAFRQYIKHNSEMPAPADIVSLIERGGKPPLERSVYVSISKKEPEYRSAEDWEYMRDYEYFAKTAKSKAPQTNRGI